MKHIKVSDTVYEELSNRKYREESFDEVLKRELGFLPENLDELLRLFPERLRVATKSIVHDYINELDHYKTIGEQGEDKQVLHFLSKETEKLIFEVAVYKPNPEGRINHRIDFRIQNQSGEMERILQLRDLQEESIDIEYKDSDTQKTKENTRKGDSSGKKTADDFGPHVSKFVEQAFENWGRETNSN